MPDMTAGSQANNGGPYLLFISGLPLRYTWQDLKDLVRCEAAHGIWTEISLYPRGPHGEGNARVQRWTEAWNVYKFLIGNASRSCENRNLTVHLWEIGGETARFIDCNCGKKHSTFAQCQEVTRKALDYRSWQPVTPVKPARQTVPTAQQAMSPVPTAELTQAMSRFNLQDLAYAEQGHAQRAYAAIYGAPQQQKQQQQSPPTTAPFYAVSPSGAPVNGAHGYALTEARGVFVSNISYKARAKDVEALFAKAGTVVRCELQKDAASGKSKGHATIQFARAEDAQRARETLHGRRWMDLELNVRIDRETTTVVPPPASAVGGPVKSNGEPIIVDGSSQVR